MYMIGIRSKSAEYIFSYFLKKIEVFLLIVQTMVISNWHFIRKTHVHLNVIRVTRVKRQFYSMKKYNIELFNTQRSVLTN